jgi:hypothetical protein
MNERHWKPYTLEEKAELKRLCLEGKSWQEITQKMGRSRKSIMAMKRNLGMKLETYENGYRKYWVQPFKRIPTQLELAYLAGIVDGEGTVTIVAENYNKKYLSLRPEIIISNTSNELMDWITSTINESTKIDQRKHGATSMQIVLRGFKIAQVLQEILPYMIIKKKHSLLAIEFIEERLKQKLREPFSPRCVEIFWAIRKLNLSSGKKQERFKELVQRVNERSYLTSLRQQGITSPITT